MEGGQWRTGVKRKKLKQDFLLLSFATTAEEDYLWKTRKEGGNWYRERERKGVARLVAGRGRGRDSGGGGGVRYIGLGDDEWGCTLAFAACLSPLQESMPPPLPPPLPLDPLSPSCGPIPGKKDEEGERQDRGLKIQRLPPCNSSSPGHKIPMGHHQQGQKKEQDRGEAAHS